MWSFCLFFGVMLGQAPDAGAHWTGFRGDDPTFGRTIKTLFCIHASHPSK